MDLIGTADDGAVVAIEGSDDVDETALSELDRRWPPFGLRLSRSCPEGNVPARTLRMPRDHATSGWDRLESDLGLFTVERLEGLVAIHAATLVIDGSALPLPGRSHAGKTTLALALAEAGAMLASDEYALVDRDGRVTGWPRPARVRVGASDSRREPVAGRIDPVPVGMVALLRYDAKHPDGDAVLAEVPSRADAVVAVLDETVCARSRPDESLDAALAVTASQVLRGTRGESAAAAAWLLERMRAGR